MESPIEIVGWHGCHACHQQPWCPDGAALLPVSWPRDIQYLRCGSGVAEVLEIAERPHDLFGAGDLDHLRIVRAGVAIAQDDVAVWQYLQGRDPGELDSRQIVLLQR